MSNMSQHIIGNVMLNHFVMGLCSQTGRKVAVLVCKSQGLKAPHM